MVNKYMLIIINYDNYSHQMSEIIQEEVKQQM